MEEDFSKDKLLNYWYYKNKDYYRDRYRQLVLIGHYLRKYEPFNNLDEKTQENIIEKIELSCFDKTKRTMDKQNIRCEEIFNKYYNTLCFKILNNIRVNPDDEESYYLVKLITEGKIKLNIIAKLNSTELNPLKNKDLVNSINMRRKQTIKKKITTKYKCRKCGENRTTETSKQLRGLDEGVTLIIRCENEYCGNVWKINT